MANQEVLRKEWNISHTFGKNHNTYFTLVTFTGNRDPEKFLKNLDNAYPKLARHIKVGKLRLVIVGITLGSADAVIVWQANEAVAVKAFMSNVLAKPGLTTKTVGTCSMSHVNGPRIRPPPPPPPPQKRKS